MLCPEGEIQPHCLPDTLTGPVSRPHTHDAIDATLKSVEAQTILDALKRNNYNQLATARELGIHKSTLFRKIKTLGIDLPAIDGRSNPKKSH